MTVDQLLHKLWSHTRGSEFERVDEKRLWMVLQDFIERNGGCSANARDYDTRGGAKTLDEIKPQETIKRKIKKLFKPPLMG